MNDEPLFSDADTQHVLRGASSTRYLQAAQSARSARVRARRAALGALARRLLYLLCRPALSGRPRRVSRRVPGRHTMTTITTTAPVAAPAVKLCACGCNRPTKSTWFPGDDAKAKLMLRAVARGERTVESLPGRLPEMFVTLVAQWGLGSVTPNEDGTASVTFNAEAVAPPKSAAKNEHPAMRHVRAALAALEKVEADDALLALIAKLPQPATDDEDGEDATA